MRVTKTIILFARNFPRVFGVFILMTIVAFCPITVFSQTGPGGVGNITSNPLWLQSEVINQADGSNITTWSDVSGNGNDLTQPQAQYSPVIKTGVLNGFPVVRFNKTNNRIRRVNFNTFPTTEVTTIFVTKNQDKNDGIISYASTSSSNDYLLYNSNNIKIHRGSNAKFSGADINDNLFHIINTSWKSSNGSTRLWTDGNLSYTFNGLASGTAITTGGCFAIAGEQDAIDGAYQASQANFGDWAEIMVFDFALNQAQNIIISNYLSSKYNLTISNDRYSHDAVFPYDVTGIGRETNTNIHPSAMSSGILQIENATSLDNDQEYLLFGHDNNSIASWTSNESPDGGVNVKRINREWRLDETGIVGSVDYIIDVSQLPAQPAGHSMYALMIDSDGDFSTGASVYELIPLGGSKYMISGIDVTDNDYISIASLNPVVEFTSPTSSEIENTNPNIEVTLNFISQSDKTVTYSTADGSATTAQPDYTGATNSITIPTGQQKTIITININDDAVVENDETIQINLSSPSAGINVGPNANHLFTIIDNDNNRKIYFDNISTTGLESDPTVNISVSVNNVDPINPTTVDYQVTAGNATNGGVDYNLNSGSLIIPAGSSSVSLSVSITEDVLHEFTENFVISLSNPNNANLDLALPYAGTGATEHTHYILDNDNEPTISFSTSGTNADESITSPSILVSLSQVSATNTTVNYSISGTASNGGIDFFLNSGTLTIPAGDISATIDFIIIDDELEEMNELIKITLSSPTNATLGVNTIFNYYILDNDQFGYLGPGGVGDFQSLAIWVKSDQIPVVADGTDITLWSDMSGNSNDLSQANTNFTPRYYSNVMNGKPVVRFEQANGRLIHNSFNDFPTSGITTILVNKNNDQSDGLVSYASSAGDNDYLWFNSKNISIYHLNNSRKANINSNGANPNILANTWRVSDGKCLSYKNNTQKSSKTLKSGILFTQGGNLAIGGEQDAINANYQSSQSHQGDFSEIIIYNSAINSAKRNIVNNYLSSKYNITIANDRYDYDTPGTYENEVTGIGRDHPTRFHNDAQGSAIIRINNPSSLSNGDYLLWGHDNVEYLDGDRLIPWTHTPPGVDNALHRTWRIDERGNIGTVSVHFDITGFILGNSNDLALLIDTDDGDFQNATVIPISSFSGNIATFDNIDFNKGNWFTLGSLSELTVLPIELLDFSADLEQNTVNLKWTTATELNNDFFTIERSLNGEEWIKIGDIAGAGNSFELLAYNLFDMNPNTGTNYYRLKQTDYNGDFNHSHIVSIYVPFNKSNNLKAYPNPTFGVLNIEGNYDEFDIFELYSVYGHSVTNQIEIVYKTKGKLEIDISSLPSGIYIVKTKTSTIKITKS